MNGTRTNQFVAPTSFMISISRRRANMAVRMVFQISMTAASEQHDGDDRTGRSEERRQDPQRLDRLGRGVNRR